MYSLEPEEIAAVIGYWRGGASVTKIRLLTGFMDKVIEQIIKEHKKNKS